MGSIAKLTRYRQQKSVCAVAWQIVGTSLTLDGTPSIIILCNTIGTYVVSSPQGDLYNDFSLNVSINSPVIRPEFDPANPNRPPLLLTRSA